MVEHFQIGVASKPKADHTPVTIADTTINQMVIEAVGAKYPGHDVLGEEASAQTGAKNVWVCDPLDGTTPYVYGIPISMFSLAFVHDGRPLMGVLYDPYQDRLYSAILGQGAFMNGRPLLVNSHATIQGSRLGVAAWKLPSINSGSLITDAISHGARSLTLICITYEAALIATGQVEGNIYPYPNPWDIAAIKVIVEEAGGKVTDLTGHEQRYDQPLNGAIISNGHIHSALVELTHPHLISVPSHKQV